MYADGSKASLYFYMEQYFGTGDKQRVGYKHTIVEVVKMTNILLVKIFGSVIWELEQQGVPHTRQALLNAVEQHALRVSRAERSSRSRQVLRMT